MNVKEAVVYRFQDLMDARHIRPNELANLSGVTPSTVYSMLDARRKEVSINVIKSLAMGSISRWAHSLMHRFSIRWNRK